MFQHPADFESKMFEFEAEPEAGPYELDEASLDELEWEGEAFLRRNFPAPSRVPRRRVVPAPARQPARARPAVFSRARPPVFPSRPTRPPRQPPVRPFPPRFPPVFPVLARPDPYRLDPSPQGDGFSGGNAASAPPVQGSEYVRWVQSSLNQVGNLNLPVDGVLGVETRSALRSFQEKHGLPADGIVGPDTERALQAARSGQGSPAGSAPPASEPDGNRKLSGAQPPEHLVSDAPAGEVGPWSRMPAVIQSWGFPVEEFTFEPEVLDEWEWIDQETHSTVTRPAPKSIWRSNTDLDAPYFGGNFNFLYNGGANEATITFNTLLSYRKKYSDAQKRTFAQNLARAVDVWDSAAQVQVKDIHGNYNTKITLRFKLRIVTSAKHANKQTDIHPTASRASWLMEKDRENVMRDLNVFIGSTRNVLVHELGHVWGLLDEYDTRWIEKKFSVGHVGTGSPLLKDKIAIMNEGYMDETGNTGEFRGRYFKHFGRAILGSFWGLKDYVIPIKHNGKVVSRNVQGRIVLLKKDIAGSAPYPADRSPFNPLYTYIQVAKR